jgi:hypothetical protein
MSAGDTPDILEACPIDNGFILSSFCLASKLKPFNSEYFISSLSFLLSNFLNFSTWLS